MNAEFDELVRASMSQFTDEVTLPAGLADRARRRVRRRRQARMGGLTAVVAAASVTAVLVVTAAGQARPSRPSVSQTLRARLTAQVIRHVEGALTKATATDPVEYVRSTAGFGVYLQASRTDGRLFRVASEVAWYRDGVLHSKSYGPGGRVVYEYRQVIGSRTTTTTSISYPYRVWSNLTGRNVSPPLTAPVTSCVFDRDFWTQAQWASQLKKLLSCGNAQVQGHQRVNGVDAIRLQTHTKKVRACGIVGLTNGTSERRCTWGIAGRLGTLFIDPSTYLPIRFVGDGPGGERIDFRFLPPNRANLAKLVMTIPPGFKRF